MDIKEPRGTVHCCTGSAGPRAKAQSSSLFVISFAQQRHKEASVWYCIRDLIVLCL